jgi:hypothetical protein
MWMLVQSVHKPAKYGDQLIVLIDRPHRCAMLVSYPATFSFTPEKGCRAKLGLSDQAQVRYETPFAGFHVDPYIAWEILGQLDVHQITSLDASTNAAP